MPIFTIAFCVIIVLIYILDNSIVIPKADAVTLKEKLWAGHNKGYINRALIYPKRKSKRVRCSALCHHRFCISEHGISFPM